MIGIFPFGQEVKKVVQQDRSPKKVFVLGVYASAVHARWEDPQGKPVIQALAAASEPTIFWRGDKAEEIIQAIQMPRELGKLVPAREQFNGPSGKALDELILAPLGLSRDDAWLCDLVPHSCMNPAQWKAIERSYLPVMDKFDLPYPTVPRVPSSLSDAARRAKIVEEWSESQTEVLILLGDQPIRWFLKYYDRRWKRLSDFPEYGRLVASELEGRPVEILPLAHPRQIARLGRSSNKWYEAHQDWLQNNAKIVSGSIGFW